ncbi:hypothetical protein Tco_1326906 [Tanacetum coccineum]
MSSTARSGKPESLSENLHSEFKLKREAAQSSYETRKQKDLEIMECKSLATWEKDDGITTLVKSILDGSALGSFSHGRGDFIEERATGNTNIKQSLRKVVNGHFTTKVKVLSSFGVAPYCTSCGRDGLRAQHILDALCGEGSATATYLLKVTTSVVNLWLAGRCPPILAVFFAFAPLTPLLKPDNGIQPIADRCVGDAKAVLHSVNRVLSEYHSDGSVAMLTLDFSHAFNLVDRSALLYEIKDNCKLLLHAWYLDDGTVIEDSPSSGVKLLGGAVSRDADFISGLAMWKSTNAIDLMSLLPQLHDSQSELLLLRSCMVIAKLFLGLRTCQPVHMEEDTLFFDKDHILCDSGICGMDDDYVSTLACLCDTIPSFDFSGFTNKDTVPSKAQKTLTSVLFSEILKDMEVHFDMTMRQKAVFECLRAPHAQDFLLAILIDELGQHMSPVEYRTILKYRLMILLFSVDAISPVCRKACLDSFREYAIHCKKLPGFKYRQDMVRDILFDIRRCAGISAKKEAPINFLTNPSDERSTLRPSHVLVFGWVGGKYAYVDLTGVCPLVRFSSCSFTAGQAALKAASYKVTKHEKACIENQHVFIPFTFDIFGFLAPEAVELLSRVQWVMHNNVMIPRSTDMVFKRIDFAIQKKLVAQLVARLSFTTM